MTLDTARPSLISQARALDRYRWQLLRERHGVLGSSARFLRDALKDWWFGFCAKCRLEREGAAESCDFLLLQSAPKVIGFQRKQRLMEELRRRGFKLVETALPEVDDICKQRQLREPPEAVPIRYFGYAAHAEWLVERYQPRILLNDRNGSLFSPFLRNALNRNKRLLVHLAHATTVEASQRLAMNDYDYYFVFGQSSLDALKARTLRFGSSTVVLAGSHMIDTAYELAATRPGIGAVLVLGVGPDKEKLPGYQQTYALIARWARCHPEHQVLIKAHPRSRAGYWREISQLHDNVQLLPADCSLAEALGQAWLVLNIMSNAVIEAALARRPIVPIATVDKDIFSLDRFLGSPVGSAEQLEARVVDVVANYAAHLAKSDALACFHLAYACQGLPTTLEALESLLESRELPVRLERTLLPTTIN